jgi:hypothetical protein
MKHHRHDSELDDIIATLSRLPVRDVSTALSSGILTQAHGILIQRKRVAITWRVWLARFYTSFLEPVLVSSVVVFYTLWAFERAAVLLHL